MILIQTQISIIQSIVYFIAAAVPIYLNFIIKNYNNRNNHLRYLSIVLAGFVTMQGMYHFAGALGFSLLAKAILEPLSFGILLFFGIIYLINRSKGKEEVKELQ
ncbi:MAG: hypothetical protein DLM72_11105 [Candidatus Nitrosopolaris wilkensis]|nr:MAG: hypothetical protein DLM72_11105 [Candidatus Nitrosopolaris wilkensis]